MLWLAPFVLLITFELVADIFAKEWALGHHGYFWILALTSYCIGNFFWLFALKNGTGLARGAIMFSLASEILAIGVAFYYYHEHISVHQWIGIGLGMIALGFLFWE